MFFADSCSHLPCLCLSPRGFLLAAKRFRFCLSVCRHTLTQVCLLGARFWWWGWGCPFLTEAEKGGPVRVIFVSGENVS